MRDLMIRLKLMSIRSSAPAKVRKWYPVVAMALFAMTYFALPAFMADPANAGNEVITAILNVAMLIVNIVGIIFIIVGLVRFVISHAQEDGPGQQKAIMLIATGLALILLRIIVSKINFQGWIEKDYDENLGSGSSK